MDFGSNFIKARTKVGMDQKTAALELNVSPAYLSRVESNKQKPSIDLILHAAEIYHVKPGFFFYEPEQIDIDKIKTDHNKSFIKDLDLLTDGELKEKYSLKFEGKELTEREIKGIRAYLRSLRELE